MNPTFHLFCRISPASPPAFAARLPPAFAAGFAARFRRPSPPALLRPSRLHPRPRRLFLGRPLRVLLCVSAGACFPAACFASLPCVPARPVSRPPAPLSTLPAPAQLAGLRVSSSPSRRASCSNTVITRSVRAAIVRSSL